LRWQAGKSVLILDAMLALFGDGECWIQKKYVDGKDRYCLMGALDRLRRTFGGGDRAGVYLREAVCQMSLYGRVTHFNDDRNTDFSK
jgi:hypothetical protein